MFAHDFQKLGFFNFQVGMELRVYKACETNSLQTFLTNYTDAQFVLSLQSALLTTCSYFNECKEAGKKKKKRKKKKRK